MALMEARIIHLGINRTAQAVYDFASNRETMPLWASGLASGLEPADEGWIARGPLGDLQVHFSPPNAYGVLDHTVVLPSGQAFFNALRVIPNGDGAEIMFTLLRQGDVSDGQYETDAEWVRKDLVALKTIMERKER